MTNISCSQAGCPVATSGRCLEGFDPASICPYQAQSDLPQEDESVAYSTEALVDLPSGEALTERQASEVTSDDFSKVIIIAGPFNGGKTTILTSLFEAFQEAPFGNFLFRGSRTLVGFERRCHLGREESGAEEADTTHTSMREGLVFLHLALAKGGAGEIGHTSLLLSDVSGELFRRLRDSTAVAKEFAVLARANHLCVVVDGEKISLSAERHVARNDSRSILRSVIESRNLGPNCIIDIVFTKWDIVVEALAQPGGDDVREFIDSTKSALAIIASGFDVRFHEVAARPSKNAKVPFAHGLPTLLRSWMTPVRQNSVRNRVYVPSETSREFHRFTDAVIKRKRLEKVYDVRRL